MLFGACIVGGLVAAGLGWIVGLPSLRLRGDYLAIVTLGFGEILRVLLQNTNHQIFDLEDLKEATWHELVPPPLGAAQGFSDIPKYTNLFWVYLFVVVTIMFAYRLKLSSTGRAFLSIREDEIAAQAMGVNLTKLKVRAFMLAAFFAGIAGGLVAHQSGTVLRPVDAGFQRSFEIVIMVVLGGLGSISGVVLAAIILTLAPALLLDFAEYRMIIYALMLILLMIFRPQGLFGVNEIWDYFGSKARRKSKSSKAGAR
jgi:branched-chain amino acid transport system permease protein